MVACEFGVLTTEQYLQRLDNTVQGFANPTTLFSMETHNSTMRFYQCFEAGMELDLIHTDKRKQSQISSSTKHSYDFRP